MWIYISSSFPILCPVCFFCTIKCKVIKQNVTAIYLITNKAIDMFVLNSFIYIFNLIPKNHLW